VNIPSFLNSSQILKIFSQFGPLKEFDVRTSFTQRRDFKSCFLSYVNPNVDRVVLKALNGLRVGTKIISISRCSACTSKKIDTSENISESCNRDFAVKQVLEMNRTEMIALKNILDSKIRFSNKILNHIVSETMKVLCKYGYVRSLRIPQFEENGYGCLFLEFDNVSQAVYVSEKFNGARFMGRCVEIFHLNGTDYSFEGY